MKKLQLLNIDFAIFCGICVIYGSNITVVVSFQPLIGVWI